MKKGLIAVLIAANLLMLVIGVLTIPPNLRAADGKESPVPGTELTAPGHTVARGRSASCHTVARGKEPARDHRKRRYSIAGGNRRGLIHGGTPRSVGLSLVHGGRSL